MTTGPNPRRRSRRVGSQQREGPGSAICRTPPSTDPFTFENSPDKSTSIHRNTYNTQHKNNDSHRRVRIWRRRQDPWGPYQDKKRPAKKMRPREALRSHGIPPYTEEKGRPTPSDTHGSSAAFSFMAVPSHTPSHTSGLSEDSKERRRVEESIGTQSSGAEPDAGLLRHQESKRGQHQERSIAIKKYLETGDMSVFKPFMAPYIDGPDKPDLGPWVWDELVERWRRKHELNGAIVWAPTDDMFV